MTGSVSWLHFSLELDGSTPVCSTARHDHKQTRASEYICAQAKKKEAEEKKSTQKENRSDQMEHKNIAEYSALNTNCARIHPQFRFNQKALEFRENNAHESCGFPRTISRSSMFCGGGGGDNNNNHAFGESIDTNHIISAVLEHTMAFPLRCFAWIKLHYFLGSACAVSIATAKRGHVNVRYIYVFLLWYKYHHMCVVPSCVWQVPHNRSCVPRILRLT